MTKEDWNGLVVIVVLWAFVVAVVVAAYGAGMDRGRAECMEKMEVVE